jgi:hypothetical protein
MGRNVLDRRNSLLGILCGPPDSKSPLNIAIQTIDDRFDFTFAERDAIQDLHARDFAVIANHFQRQRGNGPGFVTLNVFAKYPARDSWFPSGANEAALVS